MPDTPPFAVLLRDAQRGDEAAFLSLFRDTQPLLLRYLGAVAGPLAEDIASDTWVSVVRDLGSFEGDEPAAFRAWVTRIARRRWVDEVRRRQRRPETPVDAVPEPAPAGDVAEDVAARDAAAGIVELIAALPRDQADVVSARVVMGLDVAATAELLGKTPGSVRVLAHRGLRRLAVLVQAGRPGAEETSGLPGRGVTPGDRRTI